VVVLPLEAAAPLTPVDAAVSVPELWEPEELAVFDPQAARTRSPAVERVVASSRRREGDTSIEIPIFVRTTGYGMPDPNS